MTTASASTREPIEQGAFASLANRVWARYLAALTLSMTGIWIRITAMGLLVYDLTGDPFKLGLIGFVQSAPQIFLSPIAGAYLDRMNRRTVLIIVQVTLITSMAWLTALIATGRITYAWLVVISIIVGAAMSFDWPARLSLVPSLVERKHLPNAVALNAATFNGAKVLGPTLAGWLIAGAGMTFAFGVTTLSALPFIIVVLTIASIRPATTVNPAPVAHPFETLRDGYRYIWHDHRLRAMLSVDIVPIVLGMSYITMAPAIARDVLDLGSRGYGVMLTFNGIGSLAGTLLVAQLAGIRHRGMIVLVAVSVFAAGMIGFGLSGSVALSFALIGILGFAYAASSTLNDTLIQLHTEDAYRGRVMSVYSMFWGLSPAGGLLAGYLANQIGVQWAVAINGMLVLLYVPWLLLRTPMRTID